MEIKSTYEDIPIKPMYFEADCTDLPHTAAMPGAEPYVRGNRVLGSVITYSRLSSSK